MGIGGGMSDELDESDAAAPNPIILAEGEVLIFDDVWFAQQAGALAARTNGNSLEVLTDNFKWVDVTTLAKRGSVTPIKK
jgi:hypothetical protein